MASPHSRRKTTGAFGNNKPRDILRDFTRPEPAPVDTTPREPSFADKLTAVNQHADVAAKREDAAAERKKGLFGGLFG